MSHEIDRLTAAAAFGMLVTWALPGIFIRLLPEPGAIELGAWRLAPAAIPVGIMFLGSRRLRMALGEVVRQPLSLLAAVFMVGYYVISNEGFRHAPIAVVALLICLAPIWVMFFEVFSGRSLTRREVSGAAIAFTGLFLCLWPGLSGDDTRITFTGVAGALIASVLSAGFVIAMRQGGKGVNGFKPLAVSFVIFLLGFPVLGLAHMSGTTHGFANLSGGGMVYALTLSLLSTATPTICYAVISSRMPPVATALMNLLVPPCAAVAAWVFLGEYISWLVIVGGGVSLLGLFMVVTKQK